MPISLFEYIFIAISEKVLLQQMTEMHCDVLIIGAGPAGSVAARFLAQAGLDVIIVDKKRFPRRKVCGDGFTPRTTRDLYALGLGPFLRREAFKVDRFYFHVSDSKSIVVSLKLNHLYPPYSYTVRRSKLDYELLRIARESGARMLEGNRFLGLEGAKGQGWRVALEDEDKRKHVINTTFLIGADGAPSMVARHLGIRSEANGFKGVALSCCMRNVKDLGKQMEFILDKEILPGAGWIFPLSHNTANVGIGVMNFTNLKFKANIKSLWKKMLHSSPSAAPRLRGAEIIEEPRAGLLPFYMFRVDPVGDGFLLAGDAAGLVNPFCGEGVAFALESGWLAAMAILKAWPQTSQKVLQHYRDELRQLYEVPFARGRIFYRFTQSAAFMRIFATLIGGRPRLNTALFSLAYRKGAENWKELIPEDKEAFLLP